MAGMVSSEINAIVVMNFFMTHLLSELSVCCSTANGHMRCSHHGDGSLECSDKSYFRIKRITKFDEPVILWFALAVVRGSTARSFVTSRPDAVGLRGPQ
jgi:hypothetical protein